MTGFSTLFRCTVVLFVMVMPIKSFAEIGPDFDTSHWAKHDPNQTFEVDYGPMTSLLTYINSADKSDSQAAYNVVTGQALDYLNNYKAYLEGVKVSLLNRDEQLAYWLNLQNLGVIEKLATEFKYRKKIKKLRGTPGEPGEWWSEKLFNVEGHSLSLEEIEQGILFGIYAEPLAIYGLIYGVNGTASLSTEAFTGKNVRSRLNTLAISFVNDSKNVKVTRSGLRLNSLYVWNQNLLFEDSKQNLVAHISMFADDKLKQKLSALDDEYKLKQKFSWKSDAFVPPRNNHLPAHSQSRRSSYGS